MTDLVCQNCGHIQPYTFRSSNSCAQCANDWLETHYDYANFRELVNNQQLTGQTLWRYASVLPVPAPSSPTYVGGTPLVHAQRFGGLLGLPRLYIKDERYSPTNSFKDRQAAVAVAALVANNIRECVIASTGNAAVAYAAACAAAGIKLWVFMTSVVPEAKLREAALFGAEVIKVSGNYDQTKQIAADFAQNRNIIYDRGANSIPAREAMKTISYEICEQLGWQAPDWYIQAVSGGLGPLGVYHGFAELHAMGLTQRVPQTAIIQADGCSPMVQAFHAGKSVAEKVVPNTRIAILSTGDPGKIYTRLWQRIQTSGGTMEAVTDEEAFSAMRLLARTEGISVEPATAVAFAGLQKMVAQGQVNPEELIVVNCTGHTFPVDKHVLNDQWHIDVHVSDTQQSAPQEGLLAALEQLNEKATTVLLIDDNPDDAELVQRILERRKAYRVYRANDGADGVRQAIERLPDAIVMDLMMPNMDGFQVMSTLRQHPKTRDIPIIVVSAKDITPDERHHLATHTRAVYQKGSLSPVAFVEQVVSVIEHKERDSEDQ
ncbi:threonine synthase [Herpetosiphon giganteus]|uniref:threonine synthase n=1 Tax=Herpetosiphon giganteus TaxID=2029754 RepID=UPI001957FD09|nr:threonine synthase [Herpetosiphon giganteus]MBM7846165.1 threonine synthase [Herpetosiphon giganteus]